VDDAIRNLNDQTARQILDQIARSRQPLQAQALDLTPDLRQALAGAVETSPVVEPQGELEAGSIVGPQARLVSEGELARQALLLLAEDPDTRCAIEIMAANLPEARTRFDFGATIALTTAVLFALQTHVRIDRDKDSKWTLTIEKKPTSDRLLKDLVQKLLGYLPKSG